LFSYKITLPILVLFCALVITACSGKKSVIMNDTTCDSPCWRNIRLGETDAVQAMQLLQQMEDIDPKSITHRVRVQEDAETVYASFMGTKELWMTITFDDKAVAMYFYIPDEIPLGQIIHKYGEPKYIWPNAVQGDPITRLTAYFYYPDKGICLFHEYPGIVLGIPETFRATRAIKIDRIRFVDPSIAPDWLSDDCIWVDREIESGLVGQEWEGYKAYPIPYK
jgi:hypothetical protein